nr:GNAT family N-acetyltransferase [Schumannella luteola]
MALEHEIFADDPWPRSAMRSELASPHTFYLVAERDGARPAGDVAAAGVAAAAGSAGPVAAGPVGAEAVAAATPRPSGEPVHVVGYAGLSAPSASDQGDVQNIAVVPEARGTGLGRHLLRRLLVEARLRGLDDVLLEVRIDNAPAQSLYLAEGFEQIAIRPRYYRGAIDAVIMRRPLAASAPADPTEEVAP